MIFVVAVGASPVASAYPTDWDLSSPVGWSDSGALLLERDTTHRGDDESHMRSRHYEIVKLSRSPRCIDLNATSGQFVPCDEVRRVPMMDGYEDEPRGPTPAEQVWHCLEPMISGAFPRSSTRMRLGAVRALADWQTRPRDLQPVGAAHLTVALRGRDEWQPVFETEVEDFYSGDVLMVALAPDLRTAWIRLVNEERDRYESGWLVPIPPRLALRDEDLARGAPEIAHPILPAETTHPMRAYATEFDLSTTISDLRDSFGVAFYALRAALWADPANETLRRLVWSLHLDPHIVREAERAADSERERTHDVAQADARFREVLWAQVATTAPGDVNALLQDRNVPPAASIPVDANAERNSRTLTDEALERSAAANDGFDPALLLVPGANFAEDAGARRPRSSTPTQKPLPGACSAGSGCAATSILTSILFLALARLMQRATATGHRGPYRHRNHPTHTAESTTSRPSTTMTRGFPST